MNKMIIADLETQSFAVSSGIYEAAFLVVEDYEIVEKLYLGKPIDGYVGSKKYGFGFHNISKDDEVLCQVKDFFKKYPYPIIAHNCSFDSRFLKHYNWIDFDYPVYCSIQAIKIAEPNLKSYSLEFLMDVFDINKENHHAAMADVEYLYELLKKIKPTEWVPLRSNKNISTRSFKNIELDIEETTILSDEVICFSGFDKLRLKMQEIAIKNGADISKSVTRSITMLVIGPDPSTTEIYKAKEKNINIISKDEFFKKLNISKNDFLVKKSSYNKMYHREKPRKIEDIDLNIETTHILSNEVICFTGLSKYPRNTMQEIAIKNGATISQSVTKSTTILVVGEDPGSKLDKAQENGISIISDEYFMKKIDVIDKEILNK